MTPVEIASIVGAVVAISGGVYFGLIRQRNGRAEREEDLTTRAVTNELCIERHKSLGTEITQIRDDIKEVKIDVKDIALRVRSGEIANQVAQQLKIKK